MKTINAAQIEGHVAELLEQVKQGEELIITSQGKPVARLLSFF